MFRKKRKSENVSYFVSIGAGLNQIPLIREAKKCGFQVIGVDMNATAPGFYHCDLKIQESIENGENIYIKLRELLVDGKISAIMTKSYGTAIITTSFLCEKFDLPFIPHAESRHFINKKVMRKKYKDAGIKIPGEQVITAKTKLEKINDDKFPFVVKPRTGHAKRDVKLIDNKKELSDFIKSHTTSEYIFEEYTSGREIICAGLIHRSRYYHVSMSDKKTTPAPFFADIIHSTPSEFTGLTDRTIEVGQKIAEAFKIETSPLIMEFIVNEDNELFLLEAIPEFGGEFIPDIMIPAATGYNFLGNAIEAAAGCKFRKPQKNPRITPVVTRYITGTEGTIVSCSTESVKRHEEIIFTRVFKDMGAATREPKTNHDRIGVVIARGKTLDQAAKTAENAESLMNIRIKNEQ